MEVAVLPTDREQYLGRAFEAPEEQAGVPFMTV
jgi:hypothetical protein